ncbi:MULTISPECIES: HAD family hydrolase [unclassified Carboxylicivirga]|uniref:HAD family hydrolase n=1 Tax=Carboxylicivirga TaxID=1628153 RepID=UPI003D3308BE
MKELFATDLDGTILARQADFNTADVQALIQMGERGMIRIVATGRTLCSALNVLPHDFPIDYLVFSSGAGIYCWKEKKLLLTRHLGYEKTCAVVKVFQKHHIEYTLHHPIPDNHLFFHPEGNDPHPDFERYLEFNQPHAELINGSVPLLDYTQTLAFIPNMNTFNTIAKELKDVKVVRATSPIDNTSIWMECFHKDVSKASGIMEVCYIEDIDKHNVTVVGNDYNDLDMLNAFDNSFVVSNAPDELKAQYDCLVNVWEAPLAHWQNRFTI